MAAMEVTGRAEAGEALASMACSPIHSVATGKIEARAAVAVEMGDADRKVQTYWFRRQMGYQEDLEAEAEGEGMGGGASNLTTLAQKAEMGDCTEGEEDRAGLHPEEAGGITEAEGAWEKRMSMSTPRLALGALEVEEVVVGVVLVSS
jgi:hypothetical protein